VPSINSGQGYWCHPWPAGEIFYTARDQHSLLRDTLISINRASGQRFRRGHVQAALLTSIKANGILP